MPKSTKRPATGRARSGKTARKRVVGATPSGWSFFSTFFRCKWSWWLKYYRGIVPLHTADYFLVGSAYHAMHEGLTKKEIFAELPELTDEMFEEAKELYEARLDGPAWPEPDALEELFVVKDGPAKGFSSKPDALELERSRIRERKTARILRDTDDLYWRVSGSVLGEMVASGIPDVIVDIVSKQDTHVVRQIEVGMTPDKQRAFENLIADAKRELKERIERTKHDYGESTSLTSMDFYAERHFPKNFDACAPQGQVCPYYARCWQPESPEAKLYKRGPVSNAWKKNLDI